ncbi:putative fatty acyl-CoA reductase CG5065 [Manduca sexta]|uniref:putative fatty acyl-CoA reductase CG5065 n=1 Tax=Manduca sexta TaxID=7130 RepID=UPI00188FAC35|nr:putative fatty acyl-CoA reductase CG5065 [Manduca sexta]
MFLENNEDPNLSVADFYAGRSVFITGATGFLGMMCLEKLIYSCPQIHKIYVLIRTKKNQNPEQRLQTMIDSPVFTRIKKERPEDLSKIVPIPGDIAAPDLDIKAEDEAILINEVSVVFHAAATVKFNEPLSAALNVNLEGTRRVFTLSQRMKCIKVFVHISTMYTNTDKTVVEEIVYPPPKDLGEVYKFARNYGDDAEKVSKMIEGRPNTYTFTKALTETMISEKRGDLPVVIVRPSIDRKHQCLLNAAGSDNWYGATSSLTVIAKGICRGVVGNRRNILDLIPVDYVSNLTLISAAKCNSKGQLTVLNSCSSHVNPITCGELVKLYTQQSVKERFYSLPFPGVILMTKYKWILRVISFNMKTVAFVVDLVLRIIGRKPKYVKLIKMSDYARDLVEYFTSHSWVFKCDEVRALYASLSLQDQKTFPCDPSHIVWNQYIPLYFNSVKKHLLDTQKRF